MPRWNVPAAVMDGDVQYRRRACTPIGYTQMNLS